jgi:chemotaxis protein methyltransferase CheR
LERPAYSEEVRQLAQELTVTETYFFRHGDQLRAFRDVALPIWAQNPAAPARILSAGCASGEEPYSVAILVRTELLAGKPANASVTGIDLNGRMLEKALRAKYSSWSLRETPADMRTRWFHESGGEFALDPEIQRMVRFEQRNLAEPDAAFWRREAFDVVLCRNVLMYFTPEAARAAVRQIAESLIPNGLLFLGYAETLRGLSRDFHLCHTHETFYYRRRESLGSRDRPSVSPPAIAEPKVTESWAEAINRSTSRVASLTDKTSAGERPAEAAPPQAPAWDAALAAQLVHEARFTEAERLLVAGPADPEGDVDRLLLRAVLLTQSGDVVAAESACRRLLEMDEASPGGRYLMALCRETAGDRAGAADQDLIAAHEDPSFSMPRLHLGLLARRSGDLPAARREFAQALALLEREDSSRLLLFGGGFTREALIGLCRAELVACGGNS